MSPGWVAAAILLEVLSCLGYVLIFLTVFDRAPIVFGARVALTEMAFGAAVSLGGAGSIAVGAWLLHERGVADGQIAERSAVLFLLTSAINLLTLAAIGLALGLGILPGPRNPLLTLLPAGVAIAIFLFFLVLPRLTERGARAARLRAARDAPRGYRDDDSRDAAHAAAARLAAARSGRLPVVRHRRAVGVLSGHRPHAADRRDRPRLPDRLPGERAADPGQHRRARGQLRRRCWCSTTSTPRPATAAAVVYHAIALWIPAMWGTIAFHPPAPLAPRAAHAASAARGARATAPRAPHAQIVCASLARCPCMRSPSLRHPRPRLLPPRSLRRSSPSRWAPAARHRPPEPIPKTVRVADVAAGRGQPDHRLAPPGHRRRLADDPDQLPRRRGHDGLRRARRRLAQRQPTAASSRPTRPAPARASSPPAPFIAGEQRRASPRGSPRAPARRPCGRASASAFQAPVSQARVPGQPRQRGRRPALPLGAGDHPVDGARSRRRRARARAPAISSSRPTRARARPGEMIVDQSGKPDLVPPRTAGRRGDELPRPAPTRARRS